MEVNPMWFVAIGVFVALIIAYRHGRLAGFVAKVKADEEKFTTKLASIGASAAAGNVKPGLVQRVESAAKAEALKIGDEIKGWTPAAKPVVAVPIVPVPADAPTVEQRLAAVQSELDAIRALPKA